MNIKKYAVLTLLTLVTSGFAADLRTYQGDCTQQQSTITKYQIDKFSAEYPEMKVFYEGASYVLMYITRGANDPSASTAGVTRQMGMFLQDANKERSRLSNAQKNQMDAVVCPIEALYVKMK